MELTSNDGVIPNLLSKECQDATETTLYTKIFQADVIDKTYTDAQNLLMTITNGYTLLQLLIRQVPPLLSVYNIVTVDIPKYLDYKKLYSYTKEIVAYVGSHELKLRSFTAREITSMYLSYLDDKRYAKTIKECEMTLRLSTSVADIYMLSAISGTIDQLCPTPGPQAPASAPLGHRPQNNHIR